MLEADEPLDRRFEICVAEDGVGGQKASVRLDADGAATLDADLLDLHLREHVDAVLPELHLHLRDELVCSAREREDALAHEVREHDPVRDRRIVHRRAVGVADRLEEEPVNVVAAWKVPLEEPSDRLAGVVEEVHLADLRVERAHARFLDTEDGDQFLREVSLREIGLERELRIVEADLLELDDRARDRRVPVLAARLLHAARETVERDVEDVPAAALEPRRHATEVVVLLQDGDLAPRARENVRRCQTREAAADDDHVVAFARAGQGVARERRLAVAAAPIIMRGRARTGLHALSPTIKASRFATVIPESSAPTIPRSPSSVPTRWSRSTPQSPPRCLRGDP